MASDSRDRRKAAGSGSDPRWMFGNGELVARPESREVRSGGPTAFEGIAEDGAGFGEFEAVDGAKDVFAIAVADFDGADGGAAIAGDSVLAFVEEIEVG